ncbi:MAG TPA: hypothetical protein VF365_06435 [Candidatus Limnocylindria bacterium]
MARITVVDDYPSFISAVSLLSDASGHRLAGFDAAETTLEQLIDSRPDLLILDEKSAASGADELDLLLLVRGDVALRDVPLIVSSADVVGLARRAKQLQQLGNIVALEKPYSSEQLRSAVERALASAVIREPWQSEHEGGSTSAPVH